MVSDVSKLALQPKRTTQKQHKDDPQIMIMEYKQDIISVHFLIIVFILCDWCDQKAGIPFAFDIIYWRLNWAHPNWCVWSLGVESSLYQSQISEFSFGNIKLYIMSDPKWGIGEHSQLYRNKN